MPTMEGEPLSGPDEKPAPAEEAAVERMTKATWKVRREIADTMRSLENSRKRALQYLSAIKFDDYAMERRVQDRLLGRLIILQPSLKLMTLDQAYHRSYVAEKKSRG